MPIDTSGMDPKQASMVRAQEELADKNFATQMALLGLQQKIHEQQQEAMTLSNIEKAKDEAMKAVIQNVK
jgi:hypothetical protein